MMVLKMERFKKQTHFAKHFLGFFQIRDAGRFLGSQPFCLMKPLFYLLVNLVQILLHLLSSCFQKKWEDSKHSNRNSKGIFIHDCSWIFCWFWTFKSEVFNRLDLLSGSHFVSLAFVKHWQLWPITLFLWPVDLVTMILKYVSCLQVNLFFCRNILI